MFYRQAMGMACVCDVSRPDTLDAVLKWKRGVDEKVALPDGKDTPIPAVLFVNKVDLATPGSPVDAEGLDDFCRRNGFVRWFGCSAKTGEGVEEAFEGLVDIVRAEVAKFPAVDDAPAAREDAASSLEVLEDDETDASTAGCCG